MSKAGAIRERTVNCCVSLTQDRTSFHHALTAAYMRYGKLLCWILARSATPLPLQMNKDLTIGCSGNRINSCCCCAQSSALHATCSLCHPLSVSSLTPFNCNGFFGLVYAAQGKSENVQLSTTGSYA